MEEFPERWWHLGSERRRWNRTKAALGRLTTPEAVTHEEVKLVVAIPTATIHLLETAGTAEPEAASEPIAS